MKIKLIFQELTALAQLDQSETSGKIFGALPLESRVSRWGEEIYFEIPVVIKLEPGARAEVELGELGYWPEGNAFCIFFGPTPISKNGQPRAYSEVNIIGKLLETPVEELKAIKSGAKVKIEQA